MSDSALGLVRGYENLMQERMRLFEEFQPVVADLCGLERTLRRFKWIKDPDSYGKKELLEDKGLKEQTKLFVDTLQSDWVEELFRKIEENKKHASEIHKSLFLICKETLNVYMEGKREPVWVLHFVPSKNKWQKKRVLYASRLKGQDEFLVYFHEEGTRLVENFATCNGTAGWIPMIYKDEDLTRKVLAIISKSFCSL